LREEALQRKRVHKALEESEKRCRIAMSASRVGEQDLNLQTNDIYVESVEAVDYFVLDVNKVYQSILGLKRENVVGERLQARAP
jgi:PAS domain-containing protein